MSQLYHVDEVERRRKREVKDTDLIIEQQVLNMKAKLAEHQYARINNSGSGPLEVTIQKYKQEAITQFITVAEKLGYKHRFAASADVEHLILESPHVDPLIIPILKRTNSSCSTCSTPPVCSSPSSNE